MIAFQVPYKSHLKQNRENEAFCFTHKFPQREAAFHLMRTQGLKVLPLKPEIGQYIAMHARLTARGFFLLISTFRSNHLHFFPKPLPFLTMLAVANTLFLHRPAE